MEALKLVLISLLVSSAFVHSSQTPCGSIFTAPSGVIESPGFPDKYTNNLSCDFIIKASNGRRITLSFTDFDLEPPNPSGNCVDYVEIRDGTNSQSPALGIFCNDTLPDVLRTFGSVMWIKLSTDISISGDGFRATYTTGAYDESFFLIANTGGFIYRMDSETRTNIKIPMALTNPIAVDYDPVDQRVYFTERSTTNNKIVSATLAGSDLRVVRDAGIGAVLDGLTIDPFSRLLFYADTGNDVIGMVTLSTHAHKTIINSSLDEPRAIALHTSKGVMFWTDWGGPPKIERANYDGSDRRTLVKSHLLYINALALDTANNRLYWADAGTKLVESVNLDGGDRPVEPIFPAASTHHFFDMTLFRNALYITDWGSMGTASKYSVIIRQPLSASDRKKRTVFGSTGNRMNGIHAYDQNWSASGPNGCGKNNGGCHSICLPLPGKQNKCSCPDGQSLLADKRTCADDLLQTSLYIRDYKSGSPLRAGDKLTMTCTVQGGNPQVSGVFLSCQDHPDNEPNIRDTGEEKTQPQKMNVIPIVAVLVAAVVIIVDVLRKRNTPPLQDRVHADLQRDNTPPPPTPSSLRQEPPSPDDEYQHPTPSPPPVLQKPADIKPE